MIQVVICERLDCEFNGFNEECYLPRVDLDKNGKCENYNKEDK